MLPPTEVPENIYFLNEIPLNDRGKPDKEMLSALTAKYWWKTLESRFEVFKYTDESEITLKDDNREDKEG